MGLVEEAKNMERDYKKPKESTTVEECPRSLDSEVWIRTNDQGEMTSVAFCKTGSFAFLSLRTLQSWEKIRKLSWWFHSPNTMYQFSRGAVKAPQAGWLREQFIASQVWRPKV